MFLQRTDNITSDLLQQLTVFGQHYNNSLLSDVILEADHQQIHAHRVVLASQSASFKAMFEVGFCISTQVICDCNCIFTGSNPDIQTKGQVCVCVCVCACVRACVRAIFQVASAL